MTIETTDAVALPWSTNATTPATEKDGLFERLKAADRDFGPNAKQNDRAIALIGFCIGEGVCTDGHIIAVLTQLGLGRGHIGAVLTTSTGTNPERHFWQKDKSGVFSLLDPDRAPKAPVSAAHITVPKPTESSAVTP